jgi:hypothetical protein
VTLFSAIEPEMGEVSVAAVKAAIVEPDAEYDEVDLRLMDTFPASDAIGRYRG